MKRIVIFAIAAVLTTAAFALNEPVSKDILAASYIVTDASDGSVYAERDADRPVNVASLTKIMTALVVLERCSPDEKVVIKPEYTGVEGSSAYLAPGEEYTVEQLLYAMLLASGNDAATALACHAAGSTDEFAALMNEKAAALGCASTHFENPHGLDGKDHRSTARDMAAITAAAMDNGVFSRIVSTRSVSFNGKSYVNHNRLLWQTEGVVGVKTGYTKSAGRTLVSCAERDGLRLICVTLNDPDDWSDHEKLYERVFASVRRVTACRAGETAAEVPVISGCADAVHAAAEETVTAAVTGEYEIYTALPRFLYAPVKAGQPLGYIQIRGADGDVLAASKLVAAEDVEQDEEQKLTIIEKMRRMLSMTLEQGMNGLGYAPPI